MSAQYMDEKVASPPPGEVKVRKTRASKPKVKTGCQTCKIRRVKCDETKPQCLRCQKFGHQCDGYVKHASKPPPWNNTCSRTLVPKSTSTHAAKAIITPAPAIRISSSGNGHERTSNKLNPDPSPSSWGSWGSSTGSTSTRASLSPPFPNVHPSMSTKLYPALPPILDRPIFQNPADRNAFHNFCAQTQPPPSISSLPIPAHAWIDLISDACSSSPDIMNAVLALGSISWTCEGGGEREENGPYVAVGTLSHYKAWRGYNNRGYSNGGGNGISKMMDWADSTGDARERTLDNPAASPLRSESESDPESYDYREGRVGIEAAQGLKRLHEWAHTRQSREQDRGRAGWDEASDLIRYLVRSLEARKGQDRVPSRDRERPAEWERERERGWARDRERYGRESSGEEV